MSPPICREAGKDMAAVTINLEAHELAHRSGQHCDRCGTDSVVSIDFAIVSSATLQVLTRGGGSSCQTCGAEDAYRL